MDRRLESLISNVIVNKTKATLRGGVVYTNGDENSLYNKFSLDQRVSCRQISDYIQSDNGIALFTLLGVLDKRLVVVTTNKKYFQSGKIEQIYLIGEGIFFKRWRGSSHIGEFGQHTHERISIAELSRNLFLEDNDSSPKPVDLINWLDSKLETLLSGGTDSCII